MSSSNNHLAPPRPEYINQDHVIPLSPADRPPFAHYHSSSTLPPTPLTPYAPHPSSSMETSRGLKPYLTLGPRLLLTTLSPALLPLILTIAHLIQNRSSTSSLAASLKSSVLSACAGLAKGAASLQTLPRYLAMQTNEEVIRATQASILAIGTILMDCITIVEVVVGFIVDTYRSMLMCTIELAVRGTLEVLIAAVKNISDGVTSSLNSIRSGIQNDVSSANNIIQAAATKLNGVAGTFGISISIPQFSIPSLSALENVTIPTGFEDSLIQLNKTIPTLSELRDKIDAILDKPFEMLKAEINQTRLEIAAGFNSSILPAPPLSALSAQNANNMQQELCGNLDTSLIDDTANALHKLSNVAIGLMFLLLFLVWGALCIWEWRRWRAMKNTVETVEAEWARGGTKDAWRVVSIVEHPMLEKYGSPMLARMSKKERNRNNIRWYLSYLSHPTCLALLFIASLGFLSLQFQMIALDAIKNHARENANATVQASTQSMTAKLNAMAMNQSQQYATEFNAAVAQYQKKIDEELFGSWLNTTAVVLNETLVEFYDGLEDALNKTFGGTILFNPFNTFMYCILGSKITNLEKGLTWVSQHAHITLPTLPTDILVLSNSSMNEMTGPVVAAAVGGGSDDQDEGIVGSLINNFESALRVERNFYAILLGVWLAFALIGLIIVIWHSGAKEKYETYRGIQPDQDDRGNGNGNGGVASTRWKWGKTPIHDEYAEKEFRGTATGVSPRTNESGSRMGTPRMSNSFFDYNNHGNNNSGRPNEGRKGSFVGSLASLVAPGQAFLKMGGGRKTPDGGGERLVEKGVSSEKYNAQLPSREHLLYDQPSRPETPPPFWMNRFNDSLAGFKSIFPTRGEKLGKALERNGSVKTEQSFGASRMPSASTPEEEWQGDSQPWKNTHAVPVIPRTPEMRGLTDLAADPGRYPTIIRTSPPISNPSPPPAESLQDEPQYPEPVQYPRRMSRAPTLSEGRTLPRVNPFQEVPPLPAKYLPQSHNQNPFQLTSGEDSDDYDEEDDKYDQYRYKYSQEDQSREDLNDEHHDQFDPYAELDTPHQRTYTSMSMASSNFSAAEEDAQMQRVQTGTAALAAVIANMQERKRRDNPFSTPFDDRHGGRI